jgi:putative membrane protein
VKCDPSTVSVWRDDYVVMKTKNLTFALGLVAILSVPCQLSSAADEATSSKPTAFEKTFIKKAADGGMTEVELGRLAAEKGGSDEVKDFGNQMVKDHSKINDDLKEVATKMNVTMPSGVSAKHHAAIEKMAGMSGANFDKAYVAAMVTDHEKDIAEFEKADKEVKNPALKKFIEDALPMMKDHLEKIKKFDQAKG